MPDRELLRDLAIANRILAHEGVVDPFGHISIRNPDAPGEYFVSRSLGPELVTPGDIQRFSLDGRELDGDGRPPYTERPIHGAIYEARPEVMSVCHNHAVSVIPYTVTGVPLRPVFHSASVIGPHLPVWDIAAEFGATDMLVRTMEQGRSLARALGSNRVVLMRGHGAAVVGASLNEVLFASIYMEVNARVQTQAASLGPIRFLSDEEIELTGASHRNAPGNQRAILTWRGRVSLPD